jgi:hypothetical protein
MNTGGGGEDEPGCRRGAQEGDQPLHDDHEEDVRDGDVEQAEEHALAHRRRCFSRSASAGRNDGDGGGEPGDERPGVAAVQREVELRC